MEVQITSLQKLQTLYLDHNLFKVFPAPVVHLKSLTSLDLNSNHLISIPQEITNLKSLQMLRIAFNRIESMPDMESMIKLTKCEVNGNSVIPFMKFPANTKVVKDTQPVKSKN